MRFILYKTNNIWSYNLKHEMKIITLGRFKVCPKFEMCFKHKIEVEEEHLIRILFILPWYYPCEPVEFQILEVNHIYLLEYLLVAEYKTKKIVENIRRNK